MRTLLLLFLFSTSCLAIGQGDTLYTFSSYEDYKAGKGIKQGELVNLNWNSNTTLFLRNKKKVSCEGLWGFRIDDVYYRMYKGKPYMIRHIGEFIYYEGGIRHIEITLNGDCFHCTSDGYVMMVSKDLNSLMYDELDFDEYVKIHPEFQEVLDCCPTYGKRVPRRKWDEIYKCILEFHSE